jgi:hypothetical protein
MTLSGRAANVFESEKAKAPVLQHRGPLYSTNVACHAEMPFRRWGHSACGKLRKQEACLMPGIVCFKCGGPKTVRQGYCTSCARGYRLAWIAIPENRERVRLCKRMSYAARTEEQKDRAAASNKDWRGRNAERVREAHREWGLTYRQRPEVKERRAKAKLAYSQRPGAKEAAALYNAKRDVKDKRNARRRAVYQSPLGGLKLRMSSAVRYSLRGGGKESKWLTLVGYTVEELKNHLERQFLRGMGWDNMPKWHIDHIVPLVSFSFQSEDDPEFKAAWALTNLRPVWAKENVRKQARREHLL